MRVPGLGVALLLAALPAGQGASAWRLVPDLRIGSAGEDPAGFSEVRGLVVTRDGRIWVLEYSTMEIRIFDAQGKHLRTVGPASGSHPVRCSTCPTSPTP